MQILNQFIERLHQLSLRLKLTVGLLAVVVIMGGSLTFNSLYIFRKLLFFQQQQLVLTVEKAIHARMQAQVKAAELAIIPIVHNQELTKAFAQRDRATLAATLLPMYPELKARGIAQFQYHTPDSHSFFRVHMPQKFGDDLSSFRQTVNEANAQKKTIVGLEQGRGGFGFRVVVPLSWSGQHTGTVEYGLDFGEDFLNDLKADYGGEYLLMTFPESKSVSWVDGEGNVIAKTRKDLVLTPDATILQKIQGGGVHYQTSEDGRAMSIYVPINDYSGRPLGFIVNVKNIESISEVRNQGMLTSAIITAAGIVVSIVIAFIMVTILIIPVSRSIEFARSVASGDLRLRMKVETKDEVGHLVMALNEMRDSLADLTGHLRIQGDEAAVAAKELSFSSDEISNTTQEISSTMEQMAGGATSLSDTSRFAHNVAKEMIEFDRRVAEDAQEAIRMAESVGLASREAGLAANSAGETIRRISDVMSQSSKSVSVLGDRMQRIHEITGAINSISEQINLLSLNASIEAARAGDAGRGFAVVAEQVSKLADQSRQSVSDINSAIEEIMESAKNTVELINVANREVDGGSREVQNALSAMGRIEAMIAQVDGNIRQIGNSASQQMETSNRLFESVSRVSSVAEESAAAIEQVAAGVEELSGLMETLARAAKNLSSSSNNMRNLIHRFKTEDEELTRV